MSWENLSLPYRTTKTQINLHIRSVSVIRCLHSIMPLVSISEISSLYLATVAAEAGLSLPWSQTSKTGFLVTRLIPFLNLSDGSWSMDKKCWTSSPKGNDRSPVSSVPMPRSNCPKTLCSLSPTQMMLHIKFYQDWPTGFRDIQVQKCELFVTQGQVTPKFVVWFGPKSNSTELLCMSWLSATLMMIRSKMNKQAWKGS